MNKPEKAKLVVNFNSVGGFVLDADKALAIMEMLRGAERYRAKYNGNNTTYHVWPYEPDTTLVDIAYLTDSQYALAKIAGKPEN